MNTMQQQQQQQQQQQSPPPALQSPQPLPVQQANNINTAAPRKYKKPRKPYVITKPRENWTAQEHKMFLEALKVYERDWKMINQIIKTKSVIQIRSHAQKYFLKMVKAGRLDEIPPPRPKKRIPSAADRLPNKVLGAGKPASGSRTHKNMVPSAASINTVLDTYQLAQYTETSHAANPLAAIPMYMTNKNNHNHQQQQLHPFAHYQHHNQQPIVSILQQAQQQQQAQQEFHTPPMPPIQTTFDSNNNNNNGLHPNTFQTFTPDMLSPPSLYLSSTFTARNTDPMPVRSLSSMHGHQQMQTFEELNKMQTFEEGVVNNELNKMYTFADEPDDGDSSSSDDDLSDFSPDYLYIDSPDSPLGSSARKGKLEMPLESNNLEGGAFSVQAFQQLELSQMSYKDKTLLNTLVCNLADNLEDFMASPNNVAEHAFSIELTQEIVL